MIEVLRACRDESRLVFLDWGVMLIASVAVVVYSFFYPIPYSLEVLHDVPVALIDQDGSNMSRTFARMLDAHEAVRVAVRCTSMAEASDLTARGTVTGIITVPAGFERDILRGRRAHIAAHIDATYMLAYGQVLRGLLESAGTLSGGIEIARWRATGRHAEAAAHARQPVVADLRPLFSPAGGYGAYVVPAVLILVLQQTLLIGAGMAGGTRRERGANACRLPHAWSPVFQVLGRGVPYLALSTANAWFCFGFVLPYLGYPIRGSAAATAWLAAPFLLSTTMMALALRGVFRRRETAVQVLVASSLPLVFLAGFTWPVEALPAWLRAAAALVPTTSAIPGFLRIVRMGADLSDVAREANTLWALALLYFPLACWSEAGLAGGWPRADREDRA